MFTYVVCNKQSASHFLGGANPPTRHHAAVGKTLRRQGDGPAFVEHEERRPDTAVSGQRRHRPATGTPARRMPVRLWFRPVAMAATDRHTSNLPR